MAIIEVRNLTRTFYTKDSTVEALKGIDLSIEAGDIYGIIGMSGAGKSTLVRCLNYLETPTSGTVIVEGHELGKLSGKELRALRSDIGMIFQSFNLLMQTNVIGNVCFPLTTHGMSKPDAKKRALELLKIVGLEDKAESYPAQLSGGQCQRVAIARALASNPKILLCDEATSALDPQTTQQILALLRKINSETGITIVIITHSMSVVREICHSVAIVEEGEIVERGLVEDIFTHPKSRAARRLIIEGKDPDEWEAEQKALKEESVSGDSAAAGSAGGEVPLLHEKRKIRIVFGSNSSYEPVIANMVLHFGKPVNILKADTKDVGGTARGEMILGLADDPEISDRQIAYLRGHGLAVDELADGGYSPKGGDRS